MSNFVAGLSANLNPRDNILISLLTNAPALIQVIAFFLVWAGCWLPLAILCAIAIGWRPPQITTTQKLPLLASLYIIAPLVLWQASRLVGKSFSDYGLVWNLGLISSLGKGLVLAVLSLVVLFAIQTALGWVTWQNKDGQIASVLLFTLLLAFLISGIEEGVFRGFVLTQLRQDYTIELAAAISSLIFALLHLLWEQKETVPQLPGLWLMGMVLVLARWTDGGSLGLAWGLHTGWVWAIASLDTLGIVTYTGNANVWVTGKNGKPLAGAVGIICMLGTGTILWLVTSQ